MSHLYQYCTRDSEATQLALNKLLMAEEKLKTDKSFVGIFGYLRDLQNFLTTIPSEQTIFSASSLIKFFEPTLIDNFLKNTEDEELKDKLIQRLILLYLALGLPFAEEVLSPEEFLDITSGLKKDYRLLLLVRTLGKIVNGELDFSAYEQGLLALLPPQSASFVKDQVNFGSALTVFLTLVALWQNFGKLSDFSQSWLLSQYLHLSVALGINTNRVLDSLVKTIKPGVMRQEMIDAVGGAIFSSEEEVLISARQPVWKKLAEIVQAYSLTFLPGKPDGYKQEEFLQTLYKGEPEAELYRRWLRPVLQLVFLVEEWHSQNLS